MAFPSLVDELHLAEPLRPLILDFDFFDQACLGRHRRLDARNDVVSRERRGGLVRMRRTTRPPAVSSSVAQKTDINMILWCREGVPSLLSSHGQTCTGYACISGYRMHTPQSIV